MKLVADSHAIVWYVQGSPRLSSDAASALSDAEASDGIVLSVASLVDLRYVTQTTQAIALDDLTRLRFPARVVAPGRPPSHDVAVADLATRIPRSLLTDPWDRFIVATAIALGIALVTRDAAIHRRSSSRRSGS